MSEEIFLCLMYIFILFNRKHYNKSILNDFRHDVIKVYKESNSVSDFCFNFLKVSVSLDKPLFHLRSKFITFIRENNYDLGYKY